MRPQHAIARSRERKPTTVRVRDGSRRHDCRLAQKLQEIEPTFMSVRRDVHVSRWLTNGVPRMLQKCRGAMRFS